MSQLPGSARVNQYTASAGQTTFTYDFKIYDDDEITVQQNSTTLTLTTDYTVTGAGDAGGGTIVLVSGATLNDIITLTGNTMVERETTFTNGGEFSASAINGEYNKILYLLSENVTELAKSVNLAVYDPSFDAGIPTPVANRAVKINAAGTGFEMSTYDPDDASDAAAAAAASAAAAAISETNAGLSADEAEYWASSINLSAVGVDIVPDSDATRSLGKSNFEWAELHVTDCNVYNDLFVDGTMELLDDLTINVNKFTVDAATGNTAIAGTLTVGGVDVGLIKEATYNYNVAYDTDGGGLTTSWAARPLNTEVTDTIGASLSANQVTLPAGTYFCYGYGYINIIGYARHRIYDTTGSASLVEGANMGTNGPIPISGTFTLASQSVVEFQAIGSGNQATNGLGLKHNTAAMGNNYYTSITFIKLS